MKSNSASKIVLLMLVAGISAVFFTMIKSFLMALLYFLVGTLFSQRG